MWTRGEGVQNPENFADVIYGWSLDVLDQRALQGERLAALAARERLLTGVEPLVVLQGSHSVVLCLSHGQS